MMRIPRVFRFDILINFHRPWGGSELPGLLEIILVKSWKDDLSKSKVFQINFSYFQIWIIKQLNINEVLQSKACINWCWRVSLSSRRCSCCLKLISSWFMDHGWAALGCSIECLTIFFHHQKISSMSNEYFLP